MGATDFVGFATIYFIFVSISMIERLYIDPCIKNLECLWPRWKFLLVKKLKGGELTERRLRSKYIIPFFVSD